MMEKIYTAKTEEAAKEQAVNEFAACGIEESDIEFEILEPPVKKLFRVSGEYKIRAYAAEPVNAAEEEAPAAVVAEAQDASNKQFNKYNYEKDGNYTFADDCRSIRICPDSI
jgi:hypothetical protein